MFDPLETTGGQGQMPQEIKRAFMLYINVSDMVWRPKRNDYGLTPMALLPASTLDTPSTMPVAHLSRCIALSADKINETIARSA